ncbi:MAG TPA: PaaX family transcriptional regulator C-terminal domain-containing protein, partial [Telluria sp.]
RAYRRIYDVPAVNWDGRWTLLMAGPGGLDAPGRASLRKQLLWEGYAMIGTGVFGHPAGDPAVLDEILGRANVRDQLYVFSAGELPQVGSRPLRELVDEAWYLSDVAAGYRHFIEEFSPLQALLPERVVPEQAFVIRTLLIHAYRRVQLHDPMLPVELLPQPWPGVEAYNVARALYLATYKAAEDHIMTTLRREDADAKPAEDSFYQRFGGLPR